MRPAGPAHTHTCANVISRGSAVSSREASEEPSSVKKIRKVSDRRVEVTIVGSSGNRSVVEVSRLPKTPTAPRQVGRAAG